MLKGIPKILSPELLKILCEMGHGDRLVIGDGNFPAGVKGADAKIVRADGLGICELLDGILTVFPLDPYVEHPVTLMELMACDKGHLETPIWDEYEAIIAKHDERGADAVAHVDRFDFYDVAKTCYLVIPTGEGALYANIILQKGVV